MSESEPDRSEIPADLPAIDFESPGRFAYAISPATVQPGDKPLAGRRPFDTAEQAREHALNLLRQARRSLSLFTPDLEAWLYNDLEVQQACALMLRGHPRNRMRVLIADSSRAIRESHRLLALSRRLTSTMQIRKLNPDYPMEQGAYLIVDDHGLLVRPSVERFAGYALYQDAARARQRQQQFDTAWSHSLTDPELRSFLL